MGLIEVFKYGLRDSGSFVVVRLIVSYGSIDGGGEKNLFGGRKRLE